MPELDTRSNLTSPQPAGTIAEGDHLMTADEVRRLAGGISDMTLWRWLGRGILPKPLTI
jgi:hypothetical protein